MPYLTLSHENAIPGQICPNFIQLLRSSRPSELLSEQLFLPANLHRRLSAQIAQNLSLNNFPKSQQFTTEILVLFELSSATEGPRLANQINSRNNVLYCYCWYSHSHIRLWLWRRAMFPIFHFHIVVAKNLDQPAAAAPRRAHNQSQTEPGLQWCGCVFLLHNDDMRRFW